jgi:anti-sigma-K factor RskA
MTASSKADAGVFTSTRLGRAVARTAITAVLAVVFGLSVMVEVSNTPEGSPPAATPVVAVYAVYAASTPAARQPGEPLPEGSAAAF